ncbi:hypothetical protein MSAN_01899500 [Mycena sanguinolenta]|uniref:Uncharacterized protein n=1 Tax=Mycena sanguinolenta TaxID=230812 RepID=A0A8H6XRP2_9AGAR|nr:hypothetical protein MSAN_01899500 [Mycena sanguinolenta]
MWGRMSVGREVTSPARRGEFESRYMIAESSCRRPRLEEQSPSSLDCWSFAHFFCGLRGLPSSPGPTSLTNAHAIDNSDTRRSPLTTVLAVRTPQNRLENVESGAGGQLAILPCLLSLRVDPSSSRTTRDCSRRVSAEQRVRPTPFPYVRPSALYHALSLAATHSEHMTGKP